MSSARRCPGYGFSDKPAESGWGVGRIAAAWAELMARLGYERYGASGSDWGTSVSTVLGQRDREHVVGIHLVPPLAPPDPATFDDLTEAERSALAALEHAAECGLRLLEGALDTAADRRIRTRRLARHAVRLDRREAARVE